MRRRQPELFPASALTFGAVIARKTRETEEEQDEHQNHFADGSPKLNHAQSLLTKAQLDAIPPLMLFARKGREAIAHVKFFGAGFTWFATEYDPSEGLFFGLVYNAAMADQCPDGELGYFAASELCSGKRSRWLTSGQQVGTQSVERDNHWDAKTLREIIAKEL